MPLITTRAAKPDLVASLNAVEEGEDSANANGWVTIPPPGTVIHNLPPTDARTDQRGRIRRRNLEALNAKAVMRRDQGEAASRSEQPSVQATSRSVPRVARQWPSKNIQYLPRQHRIFVRPSDPQRAVLDLAGRPYPAAGSYVPAGDAYVHRRLRDGSLVRADPP